MARYLHLAAQSPTTRLDSSLLTKVLGNHGSAYAALLLRLALGLMFIAHGWLKISVFTLAGTAQFFASQGFPGWLAYPVTGLELCAGALLLLGIRTRWVALAMVPILLGAASVHWGNGWVFSAEHGGWEYPAFLTVAVLVQALLGSGVFALERVKPSI